MVDSNPMVDETLNICPSIGDPEVSPIRMSNLYTIVGRISKWHVETPQKTPHQLKVPDRRIPIMANDHHIPMIGHCRNRLDEHPRRPTRPTPPFPLLLFQGHVWIRISPGHILSEFEPGP